MDNTLCSLVLVSQANAIILVPGEKSGHVPETVFLKKSQALISGGSFL